MGVLTGLRISELQALGWDAVDFNKSVLYISIALVDKCYKTPKTAGSTRVVELCDLAVSILQQQYRITVHLKPRKVCVLQADNKNKRITLLRSVFYNSKTNKPFLNAKQFNKSFFAPLLKSAGVSHRGVGQLRHTFASQALTTGISKEWIAKQMGHTSAAMIDIHYGRWMAQDAPNHAEKISTQFATVFGSGDATNQAVQPPSTKTDLAEQNTQSATPNSITRPVTSHEDIALTSEQLSLFVRQHREYQALLERCIDQVVGRSDGEGAK
ncbi:site-specific integrase [Shewanella sp. UCD-FRSSP16_17]|uniref:site-specific integrase n=1 Tax=Shewanella sp. UCD-FRSSP16_17 TaxID=1853256 RepID=UPI0009ED86E1|nr:site-specific integrase [Shewanella sp. UCD-FRSSP16_17]